MGQTCAESMRVVVLLLLLRQVLPSADGSECTSAAEIEVKTTYKGAVSQAVNSTWLVITKRAVKGAIMVTTCGVKEATITLWLGVCGNLTRVACSAQTTVAPRKACGPNVDLSSLKTSSVQLIPQHFAGSQEKSYLYAEITHPVNSTMEWTFQNMQLMYPPSGFTWMCESSMVSMVTYTAISAIFVSASMRIATLYSHAA